MYLIIFVVFNLFFNCYGKLQIGGTPPLFSLQGDDGRVYNLADYYDQKVVLCFYPWDNSHYCVKQACNISQNHDAYQKHGIIIFGINHESIASHSSFKKKHNLHYTLLSDPSCLTSRAYGAYSFLYIKRLTVLIDKKKIVAVLDSVDVYHHTNQIFQAYGISTG